MEIHARFEDSPGYVRYYANFVSQDADLSNSEVLHIPLSYRNRKAKTSSCLNQWMHFDGDLRRGSTLLVSLLTIDWDMPIDLKFVVSAQMIEALARYGQNTKELSEAEFKRRLSILSESIESPTVREWALGKLKFSNEIAQRKIIANLLSSIGTFAQELFPDQKKFICVM
jgi:hypothetical protein